jgi:hypothetical protein
MDVRLILGLVYLDGLLIRSPLVGHLQVCGQDRDIRRIQLLLVVHLQLCGQDREFQRIRS